MKNIKLLEKYYTEISHHNSMTPEKLENGIIDINKTKIWGKKYPNIGKKSKYKTKKDKYRMVIIKITAIIKMEKNKWNSKVLL